MSRSETRELVAVLESRLSEADIEGRMALALLRLDASRYHDLLAEQGLALSRLPRLQLVPPGRLDGAALSTSDFKANNPKEQ